MALENSIPKFTWCDPNMNISPIALSSIKCDQKPNLKYKLSRKQFDKHLSSIMTFFFTSYPLKSPQNTLLNCSIQKTLKSEKKKLPSYVFCRMIVDIHCITINTHWGLATRDGSLQLRMEIDSIIRGIWHSQIY